MSHDKLISSGFMNAKCLKQVNKGNSAEWSQLYSKYKD